MKKTLVIIIVIVCGVMLTLFVSTLFMGKKTTETIEDIVEISSQRPTQEQLRSVSRGTFTGVGIHAASGTVRLIKNGETYFVRLDDDFSVTNGPDLVVALGKDGAYASETILAPLKGNEGGQNYEIPAEIDVTRYNEVWIWCKAFSVGFGKAGLEE